MSETLTRPDELTVPYEHEDEAPGERKTHVVNPPKNLHIWQPGMSMQEVVDIARMTEQEVVALCGYTWVPKRNPDRYDACSECMRLAGELIAGKEGNGG